MEFIKRENRLILSYTPNLRGESWIYKNLQSAGEVRIAKRFLFKSEDLISAKSEEPDLEFEPVEFILAELRGEYYQVKKRILNLENSLYLHKDLRFSRKIFLAERDISIFGRIDKLSSDDIYVGGSHHAAIPTEGFEELLSHFPTSTEVTRYAQARISSILSEYLNPKKDYLQKFHRVRNLRGDRHVDLLLPDVAEFEQHKFEATYCKLKDMLNAEETPSENRWQEEIVDILQLLYPKYVRVFREPPIRDPFSKTIRRVDFLLVDASGTIDLIEIKKPSDSAIVTPGTYRDNHVPLRELSGSIMQLEKYIFFLNRWGSDGERTLTQRYAAELPTGMKIKITNPSGIVIAGRSHNLSNTQLLDFEVIRRKYKNLVDIITYDDLLNRLERIIDHWRHIRNTNC
ncbi:Shedu immune nuclease family protein [Leptothoe spongobia]|uniref:DUF4263 domain-containing protein n=1 Tax=Leptothoe spongobia TAU-MAC 1115 TaxID=1967444 RepID=A0A947DFT4_9CYAN|nr:Shedu immune nuclease family protein [Leptothoe spongobia]MBT9315960.1 DUF4263 domain-containing protein [Leptothoe spongobia TAU-MAC 1115]